MRFISKNKFIRNEKSYSQSGEDVIVNRILGRLGIPTPYYLDLGAFHPHTMSNTFHFYEKECEGVLVEANPKLIPAFKKHRPKDQILNIGVGTKGQDGATITFFIFENQSVSTFSEQEAKKLMKKGERISEEIQIPVYSLDKLLETFCTRPPDFISVDLEGLDLAVLSDFDFEQFLPKIICVETIIMPEEIKNVSIIDLLNSKGYMLYADTYINSIFVHEESWRNRY